MKHLNRKQKKALDSIFENPIRSDILWNDIINLLIALEAEVSEGRGSRVRIYLNGVRAVFHRPHPQKEANRGTLKSIRRFLRKAGVRE